MSIPYSRITFPCHAATTLVRSGIISPRETAPIAFPRTLPALLHPRPGRHTGEYRDALHHHLRRKKRGRGMYWVRKVKVENGGSVFSVEEPKQRRLEGARTPRRVLPGDSLQHRVLTHSHTSAPTVAKPLLDILVVLINRHPVEHGTETVLIIGILEFAQEEELLGHTGSA